MPEFRVDVSRRGPRRFLELDKNPQEQRPQEDNGFFGNLADTYAIGVWGQVKDASEAIIARNRGEFDPSFDGLNHIPEGYEDYADAFAYAGNRDEIDTIRANIDENNDIRARLSRNGTMANLGYGLLAGIVDPINLIAPQLKGLGFLKGAARGGVVLGGVNAAQELVRHDLDPTSSGQETALSIGMGFAVAGLISGGYSHFTRGAVNGVGSLPPAVRARAEEVGGRYSETMANMEGYALDEVIDLDGQGVRIIEGNTGKYDANGNYIRAFFRPKEAFDEIAYGERVSRAADSALGDVIPGDEAAVVAGADDNLINTNQLRAQYDDGTGVDLAAAGKDIEAQVDAALARGAKVELLIDGKTVRITQSGMRDADGQRWGSAPLFMSTDPERSGIRITEGLDQQRSLGGNEPEGAPSAGGKAEDTIFVDTAAVAAEFENKPWMTPRYEGITPFAEDAFETPQEWLNFTILHELNHKTTKQRDGETVAAYENRINQLAYDEMRAGRLPLSPTDSKLEKLMLLPTPSGTLQRLAPRQRETHKLAQQIAGDMSTMTIANRAGQPTSPGGSVFQKSLRWQLHLFNTAVAWRKSYNLYVRGSSARTIAGNAFDAFRSGVPKVGMAAKQGKLSPQQFRDYVGRAVYDNQTFQMHGHALSEADMAFVRQAAAEVRTSLLHFEAKARELGLFDAQRRAQGEIAWREKANARDAERLTRFGANSRIGREIATEIEARSQRISELRDELADYEAQAVKPPREDSYFPRIFDLSKIRARYDDFVKLLGEAYGGDEMAMGRAKQTADRILGEGGEDFTPGMGGPRNLMARQIPLNNRELADFIVHDVETVMGIYTRRMGAHIEMHAKFGSRMLDEQFDRLRAKLADEGYDAKRINKIVYELEDMRDRVLGRFHGKDPMSWNNRAVRALKNAANLSVMGRGIYSQVVDVARTVALEGYQPLFKALHAAASGEFRELAKSRYAKQAGEAMELVNARWAAQMIENDSALMVTQQSMVERGLAAAQSPFFQLNLMNPFTVMWKDFTSLMTSHMLIAESKNVAKAVRAGKTMATLSKGELKQAQHLASWGIDLRRAQMIADMPVEQTENSGLWLANLEAWSGRDGENAREVFLGALSGNLRSTTVTPGPLQRAAIMDGVIRIGDKRIEMPFASLPFQLMSFTMSSSAKLTHAMLSGRDRNVAVSLGALLLGGYVASALKAGDNWENMSWGEAAMSSLDNSGIFGWLGDVTKRLEMATGYGPRSAFGLYVPGEDTISDNIGAVTGVAPGLVAGVIEAYANPELEDRQRAGLVRRAIPFNNLVWWEDWLKQMSNEIVDSDPRSLEPIDLDEEQVVVSGD